jgi:hypothetical protein
LFVSPGNPPFEPAVISKADALQELADLACVINSCTHSHQGLAYAAAGAGYLQALDEGSLEEVELFAGVVALLKARLNAEVVQNEGNPPFTPPFAGM